MISYIENGLRTVLCRSSANTPSVLKRQNVFILEFWKPVSGYVTIWWAPVPYAHSPQSLYVPRAHPPKSRDNRAHGQEPEIAPEVSNKLAGYFAESFNWETWKIGWMQDDSSKSRTTLVCRRHIPNKHRVELDRKTKTRASDVPDEPRTIAHTITHSEYTSKRCLSGWCFMRACTQRRCCFIEECISSHSSSHWNNTGTGKACSVITPKWRGKP